MTDDNGRPSGPGELPVEEKTVNQVVAWNLAYFRKAAGLTQKEMGQLLGGRSKRNVSADETSWGGDRTREFSAHEITAAALALGIPLVAFFLPPEDDGAAVRYVFRRSARDPDPSGMAALMGAAMHDNDEDTPVMGAYRRRLMAAVGKYLHPSWSEELARWMTDMTGPEIRAEEAEDLRADREALLRVAARLGKTLELMEKEDGQ